MNRGRPVVVSFTLVSLALASGLAHAQETFVAALRSAQEVPANPSAATGTCTVTLIAAAPFLTASCTYSGLESGLVAGHIHGSAAVGVNAPVMIDLLPPTGGTSGSFIRQPLSITPDEVIALRSNLLYINFHSSSLPGGEIRGQLKSTKTVFDLDGDGRTDPVIFRSSTETFWTQQSLNGAPTTNTFAQTNGAFSLSSAPGEWDGDGIADHWLIRMASDGSYIWSIFESRTGTARIVTWGSVFAGDAFAPADYDGDGVLDIAVFRRFTGVWYILQSSTGTIRIETFGAVNDYPSIGDYDGDGRADLTVVRPGTQFVWWTRRSSDGQITVTPWGSSPSDVFYYAPIDVDGDGRQDIMINIPLFASSQRMFVVRQSSNGEAYYLTWGLIDDFVHFGDYDGDGRTDFVSRRNVGGYLLWFIYQSSNGQARYVLWGITGDQ